MLGIKSNEKKDKRNIEIPPPIQKITKRNILQKLASNCDIKGFTSPCTLVAKDVFHKICEGFTSPCTLVAKDVFHKICDEKIPWDKELPTEIAKTWLKWEKVLPSYVEIPNLSPVFRRKLKKQSFIYLGMQA